MAKEQKTFDFRANLTFQAESIDSALYQLEYFFKCLGDRVENSPIPFFTGTLELLSKDEYHISSSFKK